MTNQFYSSEQTDLSRAVLGEVLAAVPAAILIGGWGSWVRNGGPMSHDVDLIVTRGELGILERIVDDLSESHHLAGTKWRATWRSIHLDLYTPSSPGSEQTCYCASSYLPLMPRGPTATAC